MRAVVLKGAHRVAVEYRPRPSLQEDTDVIIKVTSSGLCGSDLHWYHGRLEVVSEFVIGHEVVGTVEERGSDVKCLQVGDKVVVPFCTACSSCYYCQLGESGRCTKGLMLGLPGQLEGGQAEFVRVPLADTSVVKAPDTIPEQMLVLMADIMPTGYFAASRFVKDLPMTQRNEMTAVVIGCGPVGICTIATALTMVKRVYAIDSVPDRLAEAAKVGAIPLNLNEDPVEKIKSATEGRGADAVMEVVGRTDALMLALELVRPYGTLSSVGVHTDTIPLPGLTLYGKGVKMGFGRCPVRSVFDDALNVLVKQQDKLAFLCSVRMSLEDAALAYEEFAARKVHKVVFDVAGLTKGHA
ncbi:hypothetical protein LTR47_002228 [Exophiala xenobiotica]|nr:hypothetical protein LTR47_002228 [Exophiala xenobiotica]KAK5297396.1 hypothetical protein LTR14_003127 [Exophiala xenobiotica]KAK5328619.1 hypothetical protein LTR93_002404 [Exophiala xenobiotica]KAK5356611.1 hypothetical protein LTR61_000346 [Exophiala xenobiotica]KAK5408631.1 hypothetical protein LTR06_007474 [Exophiala xenobiotica]